MVDRTMPKNYDFFMIYQHTKRAKKPKNYDNEGNCYDLSQIDNSLLDRYVNKNGNNELVKLSKDVYAGITHIRCVYIDGLETEINAKDQEVDLDREHLWVFNIEKANIKNKAVIVMVDKDIDAGRTEYGDNPNEGAANDTIVCFNPRNGVVIIPPRSGMGISRINQFFYHLTDKKSKGLTNDIVLDSTKEKNIHSLSKINELDIRVTKLIDQDNDYKENMQTFNSIKNKKMAIKLYDGDFNITETLKYIRSLLSLNERKKLSLEKMVVNGEYNEQHQVIDLVNHRMIASNRVNLINGKPSIDGMMGSVLQAYLDNKTKLDISHHLKGGNGV